MKFVKKYSFILAGALLVAILTEGCDLLPPSKLAVKLELQPSVTLPLISTYKATVSTFLKDLSNSSGNRVYTDEETNVMTYSFTSNVASLSLSDILSTSYTFKSETTLAPSLNGIDLGGIPVNNDVTINYRDTIIVNLKAGNVRSSEVKSISIAEGTLKLTVSPITNGNNASINMKITLAFPTIKKADGSPLSIEILVKSSQSVNVEQSLNQAVISFFKTKNGGTIPIEYSQTIYANSNAVSFDIASEINVSKFGSIEGSFSETKIDVSTKDRGRISGIFKISEMLTNIDARIFNFYGAKVKYIIKNTLGVNMVLDAPGIDEYSYYSSKKDKRAGATFNFGDNEDFEGLAALGRFGDVPVKITETTTSLPESFITDKYEEISYGFGLIFEPDRLRSYKQPLNIIRVSDSVSVTSEVIIPFRFEVADLVHAVSFNTNFSDSYKSIANYASSSDTSSIFLYIENTIPLSVAAQMYFIDENDIASDSLFKSPTVVLEAANVDADGFSTDKRVGEYKVDITKSQLTSLLSSKQVKVKVYADQAQLVHAINGMRSVSESLNFNPAYDQDYSIMTLGVSTSLDLALTDGWGKGLSWANLTSARKDTITLSKDVISKLGGTLTTRFNTTLFNINLFHVKLENGLQLGGFIRDIVGGYVSVPQTLLELPFYGTFNTAFEKKAVDLKPEVEFFHVRQIGVVASYSLVENLRVKIRIGLGIKINFGMAAVSSSTNDFKYTLHTNKENLNITSSGSLVSAGIPFKPQTLNNGSVFNGVNFSSYFLNFENPGATFDLGVTYKFSETLTFGISVINIGPPIAFRTHLRDISFGTAKKFDFSGVSIEERNNISYSRYIDSLLKVVSPATISESQKEIRMILPFYTTISATYEPFTGVTFNALLVGESQFGKFYPSFSLNANYSLSRWNTSSWLEVGLTWKIDSYGADNLGFALAVNVIGFQFFLATDNLIQILTWKTQPMSNRGSVQVGFRLVTL
ncbi:hypothetical protein CHS0354_000757 [Potamilus streckersoni]|uniref:DUF5723 domain-containing protein n=1 Tax=Potamilus streckersoni TaxID=2493646 RepID=A0AAE0T757_9BIVA|nr:hypothetical protein CHS0354_000757 [Potamilus streckersoni]